MTKHDLASLAFALLASCTVTHHGTAAADPTPPQPRCGPGGPPGTRCGPPPATLVHPSVHTVTSTTLDGRVVRAVAGRGRHGPFLTLETIAGDRVAGRTAIAIDGVADASRLDIMELKWRTDQPGALVFYLGESAGEWICHLGRADTTASCVIARGGGRPRS